MEKWVFLVTLHICFLLKSRVDWFSNVQILCRPMFPPAPACHFTNFFIHFFQKFLETCVLHLLWVTEAEMHHRQILCNNNNKSEVGKASTHGLARPQACPHFRWPQIRLFHPLFQQIPFFRQQQSLILPTLFYDILWSNCWRYYTKKSPHVFLFYNVVSQYDSILWKYWPFIPSNTKD